MLKEIVSISGRPGLYRFVSQGKGRIIVESLVDGKRLAASGRDKVIGLRDVAMYTVTDDVPLAQVLDNAYKALEGKPVDVKALSDAEARELFATILPSFDEDRVRTSDIRKLLQWYNILIAAGFDHFTEPSEKSEKSEPSDTPA